MLWKRRSSESTARHRLADRHGRTAHKVEMVDRAGTAHYLTVTAHVDGLRSGRGRYSTQCCAREIESAALAAKRARWCPLVPPVQRRAW